jgi:hypothetical protein
MSPDGREFVVERMAVAVQECCSHEDQLLIAEACCQEPLRMALMLNSAAGQMFTNESFAAFALQCAKRIKAGSTT